MKLTQDKKVDQIELRNQEIVNNHSNPKIMKDRWHDTIDQAIPSKAQLKGNEHILVVDDEIMIVEVIQDMLERMGYRVTTETSSIKALERFILQPDKYDLILSDMMMLDMPGDILSQKILEIRADIPIILITGFCEKIDNEEAKSIGVRALVYKPFSRTELSSIIRNVLDRVPS